MKKYFVVEREYVGVKQEQNSDSQAFEIWDHPLRTNLSGEIVLDGWAGTTDGWALYAHDEYDSLEEARDKAVSMCEEYGGYRTEDYWGNPYVTEAEKDEGIIEIYKVGKYYPMGEQETRDWIYDGIRQDITKDTTGLELNKLEDEYLGWAHSERLEPHEDMLRMFYEYLDELKEESEEE